MSAAGADVPKSSLDRPLPKPTELNESLYALLFAEVVRYSYQKVEQVSDLEVKLAKLGFDVGWRTLELVASREKVEKRELRIVQALQHVTGSCWTALFGKPTDALERSSAGQNTYLIHEKDPLPCRYASIPRDLGSLNLASFNAGIVQGLLTGQGYDCSVTAHFSQDKSGAQKVVYVVEFEQHVMDREARLVRSLG
jgi:hypothetical protein